MFIDCMAYVIKGSVLLHEHDNMLNILETSRLRNGSGGDEQGSNSLMVHTENRLSFGRGCSEAPGRENTENADGQSFYKRH